MDNDILELIDQIESIVNTAPKVPMVHKVMVDAEEMLDICERLRQTIPRDVTRARRVLEEYEHRLAQAKVVEREGSAGESAAGPAPASAAAGRPAAGGDYRGLTGQRGGEVVDEAERRAQQVVAAAQQQAQEVVGQAEREAATRRSDADAYAVDVLQRLDRQMTSMLTSIRKGLEALDASRQKT